MLEAAFASSSVHWTLARSQAAVGASDTRAGRWFGERAGMGICVKPTANKVALTATGAATRAPRRRGGMRRTVAKPFFFGTHNSFRKPQTKVSADQSSPDGRPQIPN